MHNVSLKDHSSYRIGGLAKHFFEARSEHELMEALSDARNQNLRVFVLGGGTNILFSDEGFDGLIIKPLFGQVEVSGETLRVGAGALMKDIVEAAARAGLAGLEWAGGLPGTLGGAVRGNAGAFGGEMKDSVVSVRSIAMDSFKIMERDNAACRFGYRMSVFKEHGNEVILSAELQLKKGDQESIRSAVSEKIRYRNERHPMEYPNIGSIFKNVPVSHYPNIEIEKYSHVIKHDPFPVIPTAYLLTEAGLKGVSFGGAMFSPKHPNFIVNVLEATEADVRALIALAKNTVKEKFGIVLEEEVMYI